MKKRVIVSTMLIVFTIFNLYACKNNNNKDINTTKLTNATNEIEETKPVPLLPDVKYDGYIFKMLLRPEDYCTRDMYIEEMSTNSVDNAVYLRNLKISEKYNIEIEMYNSSNGNYETDAINSILADECVYDLIVCHGRAAMSYALNNASFDWNTLEYVDLEKPWWSQDARESWSINNKLYSIVGDISYMNIGQSIGMFFNKSILDDAGLDYPYQSVIDGQWTLEKFSQYVINTHNIMSGDDTDNIETDSFGYITGEWRGPMQVLYSTGRKIVTKDEDGKLQISIYDEITQKAYNDYFNILSSDASSMQLSSYNLMRKAFLDKRLAFYDDVISASEFFSGNNFGIVPWPKYDESIEGHPTMVNAFSNCFVVPRTTEDPERTSVIIEDLCYQGYERVVPLYFDEVLSYKYSDDAESTDMLRMIKNSCVYDLGYYYEVGSMSNMGQILFRNQSAASFTNLYRSYIGIAESKIEDFEKMK